MSENEAGLSTMFRGGQIPESVRARIMAGQLMAQSAGAASAPYTSKGVVGLKAIEGLMGGLMERSAIQNETQAQAAHRMAIANLLAGTAPGALGGGAPAPSGGAPMPSAMPMGQGGVGSDHVASPGDGSTRDLAIRTIYGEAGGEPTTGQAGVAAVLKNRLASGQYGNDMRGVILAPKQFSLWNAGDPAGTSARRLDPSSPAYQRIGSIYDGVMSGQIPDPTNGATHYYNPHVASPAWGPKLAVQNDVTIGNHRFVGAGPAGPNGATSLASAAPAAQIGDSAALAAQNRITAGQGTDADHALLTTYRQQQNTPQATRTGSADMPAPNAQPVASDTLPPGVTPDMVSAPPKKLSLDAIVTGAMAKAGMDTAGLPSAATPGSAPNTAAAQPPAPASFDPEGTGPANYDPNAAPLMGTSPTALAQALQSFKPSLGPAQAAVVPDPVPASAPDAPPSPSILPPARPPSGDVAGAPVVPSPIGSQDGGDLGPSSLPAPGTPNRDLASGPLKGKLVRPSLNDIVTGAMGQAGYDTTGLPVSQPPVVPSPQGDLTAAPPADPVGAGLTAGKDVALDPVVPDPQGSMVPPAPSSPNGALSGPQSDAAMGNGAGPMGAPMSPPPPLPDAGPMPPPGAQSIQAPADAASAAAAAVAPPFDPEGTGPANYPQSAPAARQALATALGGPAPSGATPPPKPGLDVGDPGLDAMRAGMIGQAPAGGPPSPPLPTFAQAGVPGPSPMPPQPGTSAALPATGPMPPPGGQTPGAGSSLPQTGPMPPPGAQSLAAAAPHSDMPAPNAVQAGPMPMRAPAPAPMSFGGSGTNAPAGNSPLVDPSSAQNGMRQELARQLGGGAPQSGGSPLDALGSMFSGGFGGSGAPQGANPAPGGAGPMGGGLGGMLGGMFGGGQQPTPMAAGGGTPAALAPMQGGAPQGGSYGGLSQQQALQALYNDPRTTPAEAQLIMSRLYPTPEKIAAGEGLVVRQADGTYRNVYSQPSKDQYTFSPDGVHVLNKGTGDVTMPSGSGGSGAAGWRPMTPAEMQNYGVTDGRPAYIAPNGEPHFGMPGTAGQGETAEAKSAGEAAAARRNDMLMAANSAPEKIARLKLLGTVLDNTATGPLAPEIGNAGAIATRLGIAPERLSALGIDPNQAVNNAIANKLAGEMTMSSIGAKNGGMPASNFSVAERQFIEGLYPNIENQAGGNRAVTDVLTAVEQKKMQWADAWSDYKDRQAAAGRSLSYENFEDQFRRAHSQDNIFAPIMQRYQAGGYTPTMPSANGVPVASQPGQGQAPGGAPQQGVPASPMQGGQGAPPQQQQQQGGQGQGVDPLSQARAAIARGAPRAAVIQRLQGMGINAAGL